jgi:hypothetical protein
MERRARLKGRRKINNKTPSRRNPPNLNPRGLISVRCGTGLGRNAKTRGQALIAAGLLPLARPHRRQHSAARHSTAQHKKSSADPRTSGGALFLFFFFFFQFFNLAEHGPTGFPMLICAAGERAFRSDRLAVPRHVSPTGDGAAAGSVID